GPRRDQGRQPRRPHCLRRKTGAGSLAVDDGHRDDGRRWRCGVRTGSPMRFCPFCSAENADDLAVCQACGRRLPPLPPRRGPTRNAPPTGIQLPNRPAGSASPPARRPGSSIPPPAPTAAHEPVPLPKVTPVPTAMHLPDTAPEATTVEPDPVEATVVAPPLDLASVEPPLPA